MPKKSILTLALSALVAVPALQAAPAAQPNADQLLRQSTGKIAAAKSFTFEATRTIDAALLGGRDVAEKARISVAVQRPNKLAAKSVSSHGVRRFVADGRTLTLLDEKKNHYATVPMRTSLDGLVAALDQHYGFTPPLAEFALSNPYANIREQARTITYLGRAKTAGGIFGLGAVECHRLGLKGKVADAELWVAVGDQLPRQLVATFKRRAGAPKLSIGFSSWNLAAPLKAADFAFTPPKGAQKIEMWTTAKMQTARR